MRCVASLVVAAAISWLVKLVTGECPAFVLAAPPS